MVPTNNKHPSIPVLHEIMEWAKNFQGEVGLIWGVKDPILGGVIRRMKETFPKAIVIETDAGHFLQEEVPEKISSIIAKIIYKD
jgi:pimeloyl-ACP methyl ester carboxylesterase